MKRQHYKIAGGTSDEYTQLEYIENTASAYIDSGIAGNQNLCVEAEFMLTKNITSVDCIVAADGDYWLCARSGNTNRYRIGTSTYQKTTTRTLNTKVYAIMNNSSNQIIVDGTVIGSWTSLPTFTTPSLYIFADHTSSGMNWRAGARIYYVKMYNKLTNEVYREYYPVKRNSDGVVGLYDTVTDTLFTNAGTGTFSYA